MSVKWNRAQWKRGLYEARKAEGLCPMCGGARESDLTTCKSCRDKSVARMTKLQGARKARGLCRDCGAVVIDQHTRCDDCREKRKLRTRKLRGTEELVSEINVPGIGLVTFNPPVPRARVPQAMYDELAKLMIEHEHRG